MVAQRTITSAGAVTATAHPPRCVHAMPALVNTAQLDYIVPMDAKDVQRLDGVTENWVAERRDVVMIFKLLAAALNPLIQVRGADQLMTNKGTFHGNFLIRSTLSWKAIEDACKVGTLKGGSTLVDGAGVVIPAHALPCCQP